MRNPVVAFTLTAALGLPMTSGAFTAEDYLAWFKANQEAKVQFLDGDVITYEKADLIRPFVPAEYQDEMIFEGMQVTIKDAGDLTPPDAYKKATAEHQAQASLAADGALVDFVAGQPFDPAKFAPGSKEDGYRLAWNFNYRWQNGGLAGSSLQWLWVRRGGSHDDHEVMNDRYREYLGGGGTFERILYGPYRRVYFSHRADLPQQNYQVEGKWGDTTEFREYTGFTAPFDIAGTAFLILRYNDPRKADDSWAYIPSLRRVRRISVEVKADSLLGTDHTIEDFYCFAGRVIEHEWEYVGTARMLAVARSRYTDAVYYGPNGWAPSDDWALRTVDVLRMIPSASHPYSTKFLHLDREAGDCFYANAFDRGGELWKFWQLNKAWTEDPQYDAQTGKFKGEPTVPGVRTTAFQSIVVVDVQNNRGTMNPVRGNSYPQTDFSKVKRQLDLNRLTEGR